MSCTPWWSGWAPRSSPVSGRCIRAYPTNVDFYSGFVYHMLDLPLELYTPLFAMARVPDGAPTVIEELINMGKIIRPAYQYVGTHQDYLPLKERD